MSAFDPHHVESAFGDGALAHLRREANELRHTADHTEDDAERATALADAELLDARIAALSSDWPLAPPTVAEEVAR